MASRAAAAAAADSRVDDLPLAVLVVLLSHRLCPTRLPSDAPQLLAVLRRLFCGPSAPLAALIVSSRAARTLRAAVEARDAARVRCYRTVLPLQLLERIVFGEQHDSGGGGGGGEGGHLTGSWTPLERLLPAWKAQDNLEWMLGDPGCGQHVWDMVAGTLATAVPRKNYHVAADGAEYHASLDGSPYSSSKVSSPASTKELQKDLSSPASTKELQKDNYAEEAHEQLEICWVDAADRMSSAAALLLAEMCTLWNQSFPDRDDQLHVDTSAPATLQDALLSAAAETQRCRARTDAARARALLCRRACVYAREEAVRRAMRAVDGPGRTLRAADAARAEQLLARGRATAAKVRLVRARAAREAYCADGAVPALRNAMAIVLTRRGELAAALREKEQLLAEYEALGSGFRELVVEYARLRKVLDQTLWTRNELRAGR